MGKSAGTNKTVATTNPPAFQQPYIDTLLSQSKQLYDSSGPAYYPGQTVANFAPATDTAHGFLTDKAVEAARLNDNSIQPAIQTGLNSFDVANNPAVKGMVDASTRPIIQQLNEQALPNIRSGSVASGTLGGSRQGLAEGQAVERTARAAMDTSAGIYGNAYGQGLNTLSATLGQLPALESSAYQPGQILSAVGDQQRQLDQEKINAEIAKWTYNQQLPYTKLTEYGNTVSKPFGGTATSDVTATGDSTSQTLGAILSGLGIGTSLWKLLFP